LLQHPQQVRDGSELAEACTDLIAEAGGLVLVFLFNLSLLSLGQRCSHVHDVAVTRQGGCKCVDALGLTFASHCGLAYCGSCGECLWFIGTGDGSGEERGRGCVFYCDLLQWCGLRLSENLLLVTSRLACFDLCLDIGRTCVHQVHRLSPAQ